jgi:hypothetical protein
VRRAEGLDDQDPLAVALIALLAREVAAVAEAELACVLELDEGEKRGG